LENSLNATVGLPAGYLDFGGRLEFRIRQRIEEAIGQRTADALVKQDEQ
jgi:hypothetical protein